MNRSVKHSEEVGLAYHEAAHAVAAYHEQISLQSVTIEPDADSDGKAHVTRPLGSADAMLDLCSDEDQLRVERYVRVSLAGGVAQRRFWSRSMRGGDHDDLSKANQLLAKIVGSEEELRAYMQLLEIQTRQLVRLVWWREIRAVARALLRERRLTAKEVRKIVENTT